MSRSTSRLPAERLHAEPRHDQQQIVRAERGHRAADRLVDDGVVPLEHRAEPAPLVVGDVAELDGHRVAQVVVADRDRGSGSA